MFTGTLDFLSFGGMGNITRRLLDLPDSLHFRRLVFSWHYQEDLHWMEELLAACSDTLECLEILHNPSVHTSLTSINLSKATKLRAATFRALSLSVAWITMALQTISPRHQDLRQISIHACHDLALATIDANMMQSFGGQWLDLDRLLVQLWESRSIQTKLMHVTPVQETQDMGEQVGRWLPEATERGIIDLVE
ncbi:hypothetical protein BDM02DRAFT_841941 [Thelephora ganbajun]|uniref:Uncharacterized protein n=1 Tax=Thelephora ganbajun TaxID=370292 RepID=A0ACB6Z4Y6_THEGA|nr:hypothetical protein BDM02DRAFT_841941 [Thelephora ganbajun]